MAKAAHRRGGDHDDDPAPARPPLPGSADSADSAVPADEPAVEVDVARTGGFAGITRRWTAQPPETEASEWISLIDRCPWDRAHRPGETDDSPETRRMPDRFVWWIRASWTGADPREAELPEDELTGAWRELVDAVREWSRAVEGPERGAR
ncbi:protealysin inhibitor emfourin [Microbacterium cremeum]|uniref:protealysin inhibitor emfourin n=1 Tax=Microbacterium cremeum TaxID=2782169 RepID=UPI001E32B2FF|nr:protealysin inhibitor emfourin [Microbacterium cremeum]